MDDIQIIVDAFQRTKDLSKATKFYKEGLGLPKMDFQGDISFFMLNSSWLSLYPWELLAQDAQVKFVGSGFRGITLAHNVENENQVIDLLEKSQKCWRQGCEGSSEDLMGWIFWIFF